MKELVRFIARITPTLIEEASELYELYQGSESKAIKHIADRREAIARARSARDARINEKFPKEG